MAELMAEIGMPRKVWRKAQELGAHNDCLVSGSPCSACEEIIVQAFDFFYGDEPTLGDVLGDIIKDTYEDDADDDE